MKVSFGSRHLSDFSKTSLHVSGGRKGREIILKEFKFMWLSSSSLAETLKWPNISTRTEISSGFNISDITSSENWIHFQVFFCLSALDLILTWMTASFALVYTFLDLIFMFLLEHWEIDSILPNVQSRKDSNTPLIFFLFAFPHLKENKVL